MGLSHTVSEINDDFSRKSPFFPSRVFNAPAERVPLEFATDAGSKTRMIGLPGGQNSFKIGLAV